jgi:hypothetical protein
VLVNDQFLHRVWEDERGLNIRLGCVEGCQNDWLWWKVPQHCMLGRV